MGWHKIELSAEQKENNESEKLTKSFDERWIALGAPKGFSLFHSSIPSVPSLIYVSPLASSNCELLVKSYNGSPCSAPTSSEASLYLGHDEDKKLLA